MNSPKQPSLAELTSRAVARSNQVHSDELAGDVEPHEILATFRVDAQAAWIDSQLALKLLGLTVSLKTSPNDWATFVDSSTGRLGIPMAAGQFPQRLREVAGLFAANLVEPSKLKPIGMSGLKNWVGRTQTSKNLAEKLLASGIGHEVGEVVSPISGHSPAEINEQAARLWIDGQREAALSVWQTLLDSPVASFNVGMALLMLNRAPMAISHLQAAVATLPADSGWQQLAALYLSVALIRD
jgi:hypothetical protein